MQQRQLRLGDILDDYCPRERRVTNHVIVAMVEQDIKQTRCTTCEAEHEYKHAKVPPQRRKKGEPGTLYKDVLAGIPRKPLPSGSNGSSSETVDEIEPETPDLPPAILAPAPLPAPGAPDDPAEAPGLQADVTDVADEPPEVEGPVHRPLIRATLPRPEGQPKERPIPEFTARQALTRPGRVRPGGRSPRGGAQGFGAGHGQHPAGGNRARRGHPFAAAGQAHGGRRAPQQGHGQGQGQGQGQGSRRRGGKKRSK